MAPDAKAEDESAEDDVSIDDSELLYRLVNPEYYKRDEDRPTSQALQNSRDRLAMSVYLGSILAKMGREPETLLDDHPGYGLVSITARLVRSKGQKVVRAPNEDLAHAHVVGEKRRSAWKKQIPALCIWVVRPEQP